MRQPLKPGQGSQGEYEEQPTKSLIMLDSHNSKIKLRKVIIYSNVGMKHCWLRGVIGGERLKIDFFCCDLSCSHTQ